MLLLRVLAFNLFFVALIRGQSIYKCNPSSGALDTFSFNVGSDNGVACVTRIKKNTKKILLYVDKLTPSGDRTINVATSKYDSSRGLFVGNLYRLYPSGPKRPFTLTTTPGYINIKFDDGETLEMVQKPDGIAWVPADIRFVSGCAIETPQLFMDVMDQPTLQHSKMMLCAMSTQPGSGYDSMYGFGLRISQSVGMEPFFFLGKMNSPIQMSGPINIKSKLSEVCLRSDCQQCGYGYRSFALSN